MSAKEIHVHVLESFNKSHKICLSQTFVMHSWAQTGLNPIQEYPLVLEWGMYQSTGNSKKSGPLLLMGEGGSGYG